MSSDHQAELLRRLLAHAEEEPAADHVDLELLALFAEGALPQRERGAVVGHLADCAHCRRVVSELLKLEAAAAEPTGTISLVEARRKAWPTRHPAVLALAACLLAAVTLLLFSPGRFAESLVYERSKDLLLAGNFSAANETIAEAQQHGTHSDRLSSLGAQAAREMPVTLALNEAGRLTDFGVDISGAVGRGAGASALSRGLEAAEKSLAQISEKDVDALLNRGHVALSRGRNADALADFDRAAALAPTNPFPFLGRGLAHSLNDELAAAEKDFRHAIELAPRAVAPRFNLAITLEQQGRLSDALAQWQLLLGLPLSEADRRQVRRTIEILEKQEQ